MSQQFFSLGSMIAIVKILTHFFRSFCGFCQCSLLKNNFCNHGGLRFTGSGFRNQSHPSSLLSHKPCRTLVSRFDSKIIACLFCQTCICSLMPCFQEVSRLHLPPRTLRQCFARNHSKRVRNLEFLVAMFSFMYWIGRLREFHDHLLRLLEKPGFQSIPSF